MALQKPVENWANRPQQKSIVSLNGREWLAAACFVLPKPEFLLSTICLFLDYYLDMGGGWEASIQKGNEETVEPHLELEEKDCSH